MSISSAYAFSTGASTPAINCSAVGAPGAAVGGAGQRAARF